MARISQQGLADAFSAIQQAGLSDEPDQERIEEILLATRNRVRAAGNPAELQQQKDALSKSLQPIWDWIIQEGIRQRLTPDTVNDVVWNLFAAAIARTQLSGNLALVTDSVDTWNEVVDRLMEQTSHDSHDAQTAQRRQHGNYFYPYGMIIFGLLCLVLDDWLPTGRVRFYAMCVGTGCFAVGVGWAYLQFGATSAPPVMSSSRQTRPSRQPVTEVRMNNETNNLPAFDPGTSGLAPPGVPPLPGPSQPTTSLERSATDSANRIAGGERVTLLAVAPYQNLAGNVGTVQSTGPLGSQIQLDMGVCLSQVPQHAFERAKDDVTNPDPMMNSGSSDPVPGQLYAPYSFPGTPTKVQTQAARIRDALGKAAGLQSTMPGWAQGSWCWS